MTTIVVSPNCKVLVKDNSISSVSGAWNAVVLGPNSTGKLHRCLDILRHKEILQKHPVVSSRNLYPTDCLLPEGTMTALNVEVNM